MSLGQCGLIVEGPKIAGHLVVTAWLFENVSKLALAGLLGAVMMITCLPWLYSSFTLASLLYLHFSVAIHYGFTVVASCCSFSVVEPYSIFMAVSIYCRFTVIATHCSFTVVAICCSFTVAAIYCSFTVLATYCSFTGHFL